MEQNRVVNIINFVRGYEPRREVDLMRPVVEEIRLNKKYGFENTFLLQYDAMCREDFVDLFLKEKDEHMELGVWLELARPLVEETGLVWEGRWDWDWHVNPGFLAAYKKEEKEALIDRIMEKFYSIFGFYPKSAGSWVLDSDSVRYMKEKYGLEAFGICREQWGTDGYTYWGGYYNGPYFPSKNHILHPAQTKEQQIHVPVFRLLGADPIYCYYESLKGKWNPPGQKLYTLEPTWPCAQSGEWVDWYLKNLTENEDMGYSYTQTGQENPFGWENISKGLPMQMEKLYRLQKEGRIRIEKLCDSGRGFSDSHALTPATVYSALDDWAQNGCQSVWYNCRNYRINVYCDGENVRIRDIHKFSENYRDVHLDVPCKAHSILYDALPVMDGLNFTDENTTAGIFLAKGKISNTARDGQAFIVSVAGEEQNFILRMTEEKICITGEQEFLAPFAVKESVRAGMKFGKDEIRYHHNGMEYALIMEEGSFDEKQDCLVSSGKRILLKMEVLHDRSID
ncbi:MAG: hypothetical protein IJ390_05725 [Lachnospiraceae bacterium]|nr:hypothetical protein [Lachnospiraceae bacterium]